MRLWPDRYGRLRTSGVALLTSVVMRFAALILTKRAWPAWSPNVTNIAPCARPGRRDPSSSVPGRRRPGRTGGHAGVPTVEVLSGNYANGGREWQPAGEPGRTCRGTFLPILNSAHSISSGRQSDPAQSMTKRT